MRLPPQGIIPPGRAGLIVLAAALVPVALRHMKPFTRSLGDALVKAGEYLRAPDDEPRGTEPEAEPPKPDVDTKKKTTKVGKTAGDVPITSASPTGQEELEAMQGVEAAGDGASPDPVPPTPQPAKPSRQRKKTPPDGPINPKRTGNSRPD